MKSKEGRAGGSSFSQDIPPSSTLGLHLLMQTETAHRAHASGTYTFLDRTQHSDKENTKPGLCGAGKE